MTARLESLTSWRAPFFLTLFSLIAVASPASAQEYTRRSYYIPEGSVELTGEPARPTMAWFNVSNDQPAFDPFTLPVHVAFGVTNDLTLSVSHDRGPCFNCGGDQGDFYNAAGVGMGLLYSLVRSGEFELDLHLTAPLIQLFDPFQLALRGGVIGRYNISQVVAFVFDPSLKIGVTDRDAGNREYLSLPIWFFFQANETVVPFVGTGLFGPLEGFGDGFAVPLEGGCIFSVSQNVDLGGVLRFGNLLGSGGSLDYRALGFIGRFRFD